MSFKLLLLLLLIAPAILGQTPQPVPSEVDLTKKNIRIEPMWFLGVNHYKFHSKTSVDSILVKSQKKCKVIKEGENYFSINPDHYQYYKEPLQYPCSVELTIFQKKLKPLTLYIPLNLFPPVKIYFYEAGPNREFANKAITSQPNDTVLVSGFYCRAKFEYPPYVVSHQGLKGHHMVRIYSGNKMIHHLEGWNDTGDMTRLFYFSDFPNITLVEAVADTGSIRTLLQDWYISAAEPQKISASASSQVRVIFRRKD